MTPQIFIHSRNRINCTKIMAQINNGNRYCKFYNQYLIPYHCKDINHEKRIIIGGFIHPMWNILEKAILTNGGKFDYNYVNGPNYTLEVKPLSFNYYNILGRNKVYSNSIIASDLVLMSNTILLFTIDKKIAEPLIHNRLI
jgi:hypothetical protein